MSYHVKELRKTCSACPSQWEAKLECGRMAYIRYRWGTLTVNVSEQNTNSIKEAVNGNLILEKSCGQELDGMMSTKEMKGITSSVLSFPTNSGRDKNKMFNFIDDYIKLRESGKEHEDAINELENMGYFIK